MKQNRRQKAGRWVRKFDADGARGRFLPIPTQVVSNEEMLPIPQTPEQRRVEHELVAIADRSARRLGVSRREFLSSSAGMAAAFVALNALLAETCFERLERLHLAGDAAAAESLIC